MAKRIGVGLGGLGYTRKQRKAIKSYAGRGQLPSYFQENPGAKSMFEARLAGQGAAAQVKRARELATAGAYPTPPIGGGSGVPDPGNGAAPPPTAPELPPPADPNAFADITNKYNAGLGPQFDAYANYLQNQLPGLAGSLSGGPNFNWEDIVNSGLMTGSAGSLPDYAGQMQTWRDQSQQDLERAIASQNEAYGSMGARYSSDIGREQADLRRRATTDLAGKSYEVLSGLNQQRQMENQQRIAAANQLLQGYQAGTAREGNLLQGMGSVAAMQGNARAAGADRAWQEYQMSRSPNPAIEAILGYAASFNPPGTVIY